MDAFGDVETSAAQDKLDEILTDKIKKLRPHDSDPHCCHQCLSSSSYFGPPPSDPLSLFCNTEGLERWRGADGRREVER